MVEKLEFMMGWKNKIKKKNKYIIIQVTLGENPSEIFAAFNSFSQLLHVPVRMHVRL